MDFEFCFSTLQRERFKSGELSDEWARRYPSLFDADDIRLSKSQPDRHFFEWLAAVLLYESAGYCSLIEKYESASHHRKIEVFRKIIPNAAYEVLSGRAGLPDLFVYRPVRPIGFSAKSKARMIPSDLIRQHFSLNWNQ